MSDCCFHYSVRVMLVCDFVLATLWYTRGPCHPLTLFLCQFHCAIFCVAAVVLWTRRWKPSHMATGSRKLMWRNGSHKSIPLMTQYRNVDIAHELSDKDMFACLTRTDSGDESDCLCEHYCAPKPLDFDYDPYGAHEPTEDGWRTSCVSPPAPAGLPSTPQSSGQPYSTANTPQGSWVFRKHVFKQPDEPAACKTVVLETPAEPAAPKPSVPEIVLPVQCEITPKRLLLLLTEILSCIDEDVSSIRDGYTAWVMSDPSTTLERHLASRRSAEPIFREAHERRNCSPEPKYRFDNSVPDRLREQTRISILS